jgi:hypothetical protein
MVMARMEVIFGAGTSSSPGMVAATSSGVALHRLYARCRTGAVWIAAATSAPPSMMSRKSREDICHDRSCPGWLAASVRSLLLAVRALVFLMVLGDMEDSRTSGE